MCYQKDKLNTKLKILFIAVLFAIVLTPDKICNHLGIERNVFSKSTASSDDSTLPIIKVSNKDYFVNDTLVVWDEYQFDWVVSNENERYNPKLYSNFNPDDDTSKPILVNWSTLIDIGFKLRYFKDLDMELYAPVFSKEVEELNGKLITIQGFVIPFDEDEELFALSSNPYASCFFCGKASPASILSMQMKKKSGDYKLDDYKKFTGRLYLNYDDPDEFCYVLQDSKED